MMLGLVIAAWLLVRCDLDRPPNAWYWAALARVAGVASD